MSSLLGQHIAIWRVRFISILLQKDALYLFTPPPPSQTHTHTHMHTHSSPNTHALVINSHLFVLLKPLIEKWLKFGTNNFEELK